MTPLDTLDSDIAIIGVAGRFPGARSVAEFWANLCAGQESISFFTDQELAAAGVDAALLDHPNYVKARSILDDVELFDAAFFGFTPREAELLDPQHRLFLECAWQAIESAGYVPDRYSGLISVYAGVDTSSYLLYNLYSNRDTSAAVGNLQAQLGNDKDFLPTRVSYKLNLTGPSINVNTACSTSLVAVHLACQSLLNSECDMALAGGAGVILPQQSGYLYQVGGINSPDGHCRPFDAQAQGTVRGNGVGVVVLKRLADALDDGDQVLAVIKGSALNNDGALKVGFTAPSVEGQSKVIIEAQTMAGVEPETIGYIETHGTGTALGDPIEVTALTRAFRMETSAKQFCAIGSVKSNVGHLGAAAGVTGLIKATLALHHGLIPPTLHVETPNPLLELASSPFYLPTSLTPWPSTGQPRRAGVSSFGIGGTNAHVVLEQAPARAPSPPVAPPYLLLVSAKSAAALDAATANLAHALAQPDAPPLADVAWTLQAGRAAFSHRRAVLVQGHADAVAALQTRDPARLHTHTAPTAAPPVAWLIPGQGTQSVAMTAQLYQGQPVVRQTIDRCAALLQPQLGLDLRTLLYPSEATRAAAAEQLGQTAYAQPALFVVSYALAQLWLRWGVEPVALLGHSLGEYVAATIAGVLSLEDALTLVATRGRLMQALPGGAMLAVALSEDAVQPLLTAELALAAVNGPRAVVVSGPHAAIERLEAQVAAEGVQQHRLATSHAFHSAMMEPIAEPFRAALQRCTWHAPQRRYISSVSGTWITASEATDPAYWVRQLRAPVRFGAGLQQLVTADAPVLLEVGMGHTLSALARQQVGGAVAGVVATVEPSAVTAWSETGAVQQALGRLWLAGVAVDWSRVHAESGRQRVVLPTYPFERQRFWIEPNTTAAPNGSAVSARSHDLADWFFTPSWKRTLRPAAHLEAAALPTEPCLIFTDQDGPGQRIVQRLQQLDRTVVSVTRGDAFAQRGEHSFVLRPDQRADYELLLQRVSEQGQLPATIIYAWSDTAAGAQQRAQSDLVLSDGALGLGLLAQSLAASATARSIAVVSVGACEVESGDRFTVDGATLSSMARSVPLAAPGLDFRQIDLSRADQHADPLIDRVIADIFSAASDPLVAYRGRYRWTPTYESLPLAVPQQPARSISADAAYLIVNGAGAAPLLAQYFGQQPSVELIMVGPEQPGGASAALEQAVASLTVLDADLTQPQQIERLRDRLGEYMPRLRGVICFTDAVDANGQSARATTDRDGCEAQLGPVRWLLNLERALDGAQLDFWLVLSALDAEQGGSADPAAALASALIDALALERASSPTPWLHLKWQLRLDHAGSDQPPHELNALSQREAVAVLERALADAQNTHLIVAPAGVRRRSDTPTPTTTKQLAITNHERPDLTSEYVAARTPVEAALVEIWQRLFGIGSIGVYDNFFELAGDSLLAVQLATRIQERFGVALSMPAIFERPTIASLAEQIEQNQMAAQPTESTGLRRVGQTEQLPPSFVQQRMWHLAQHASYRPQHQNDIAGIILHGTPDIAGFNASLSEIIKRHEVFRTVLTEDAGQLQQRIVPAEPLEVQTFDLSGVDKPEQDQRLRQLLVESAEHPFDFAAPPLLRAMAVRLNETTHVLLIVMARIAVDGWAKSLLLEEIDYFYQSHVTGEQATLPVPPFQYADYAVWQREQFNGPMLDQRLAYWKQQFRHAAPALRLPTDHARPAVERLRAGHHVFQVPATIIDGLKDLARHEGSTIFLALLAAFNTFLFCEGDSDDIVIGVPFANRTLPGVERMMGRVGNTIPVRTDLSRAPSFRAVLGRVHERFLEAQQHAVPYDRLVQELWPEHYDHYMPPYETIFNYHDIPTYEGGHLPGLRQQPLDFELARLDCDLSLLMLPGTDGFPADLRYNLDLFEAATVAAIAQRFQRILEQITHDPDLPITALRHG